MFTVLKKIFDLGLKKRSLEIIKDTICENDIIKKLSILNIIDVFSRFAFLLIKCYRYPEAIIRDDKVEFRFKNFQRIIEEIFGKRR